MYTRYLRSLIRIGRLLNQQPTAFEPDVLTIIGSYFIDIVKAIYQ